MKVEIKEEMTRRCSIRLTKRTLLSLLSGAGAPANARVTFTVPNGGDYSGIAVDIDDGELWIRWEKVDG